MLLPFDLNRAEDYRFFLNVHLTALVTLRAEYRPGDVEDFDRLLDCVRRDLRTMGDTIAILPPCFRASTKAFTGLGIAYVIRGSRLGAAVLRRSIAGDAPTSYLDFVPGLSWPAFLAELECIANDPAGRAEAARSARDTFDIFVDQFEQSAGREKPI